MPLKGAKDDSILTPSVFRRLVGDRYFSRGEMYFADGAVLSLRGNDNGVEASVQGTHRYRVRLWVDDGDLDYDCTCPVGRDGELCKHCVAVGLAWCAGAPDTTESNVRPDGLRTYLLNLDSSELVTLLLDQADEDERFRRQLLLRAARAMPESVDPSVWKSALDDALAMDDFVQYRDAYDYSTGVEEVVVSLEDLLRAGQAESALKLAEYGVQEVERSLENIDDSDGWMGGLLSRLQALHLAACRQVRPDPTDLAERLFEGEMESSYDTFHRAAFLYADILGEAGLAVYRRLAEAEWAKIPTLEPGEDDPNRYGARYQIKSIMEALAEADDDLDALIAVKSRDLSTPYAFLEIASLYQDKGRPEQALDWAERGWRAFSGARQDERLREFIASAYHERNRSDEAMTLIWEAFAEFPCLETFRQLQRHGRRAEQWRVWREKAITLVRERIAGKLGEPLGGRTWMRAPTWNHSLLVEIFLHEDDPETAWHEAEAGGCSEDLWLALAKLRENTHPKDAVNVYRKHIDVLLRNASNRVYEEAVDMLETIGRLLRQTEQDAAFRRLLTEIRATHKRKRNLMKMFDQKGW
jgi:uncharacterized Zn finger protein